MSRSGIKCKECNGCMERLSYNNLQIFYCDLCDRFYRSTPGNNITIIVDINYLAKLRDYFEEEYG